jgi:hypothetical protein
MNFFYIVNKIKFYKEIKYNLMSLILPNYFFISLKNFLFYQINIIKEKYYRR